MLSISDSAKISDLADIDDSVKNSSDFLKERAQLLRRAMSVEYTSMRFS